MKYTELEENGWTVECESPFEIRHEDGSFATGRAAEVIKMILEQEDDLKLIGEEYEYN